MADIDQYGAIQPVHDTKTAFGYIGFETPAAGLVVLPRQFKTDAYESITRVSIR